MSAAVERRELLGRSPRLPHALAKARPENPEQDLGAVDMLAVASRLGGVAERLDFGDAGKHRLGGRFRFRHQSASSESLKMFATNHGDFAAASTSRAR